MAEDAPWLEAKADLPDAPWVGAPPAAPKEPSGLGPMPGTLTAIGQGAARATQELGALPAAARGEAPTIAPETSPAAQPLEWSDLWTGNIFPKIGYGLGESYPTIAAGMAGGLAGTAAAGPVGTVAGGALGAAAGAAAQKLAPILQEELRKNPSDPNGAYDRALHSAEISGVFSGIGWAAFGGVGNKFFQGPVRQLALQALGVQPAVGAAEQVTQNVAAGRPALENVGQAAAQGAVGTAVPMAGHALVHAALPTRASAALPTGPTPKLDPTAPYREVDVTQPIPGEAPPIPQDIGKFRGAVYQAIDKYKRTFQPEEISDVSRQAAGMFGELQGWKGQAKDSLIADDVRRGMWKVFNSMSEPEHIEFIRAMGNEDSRALFKKLSDASMGPGTTLTSVQEKMLRDFNAKGGVQIAPEVAQHADYMRFVLDHMYNLDKDRGATYGYLQDYFPWQFQNPKAAADFVAQRTVGMGSPGFQKPRMNEFLLDAYDKGLKLKSTNPADLFIDRVIGSIHLQQSMDHLNRLNQAGFTARLRTPGEIENARTAGWHLIKDPIGDDWAIHPDLKPMWDNVVMAKGMWQDPGTTGSVFRNWMALKNVWAPIKLMASLFHPLHVSHINLTEGWARGWQDLKAGDLGSAVNNVMRGVYGQAYFPKAMEAREAWLTPEWRQTPEQKAIVKTMVEGGFSPQMSEQLRIAGGRQFQQALADQEWHKALGPAVKTGIQKMQGLVFEKWIPNLKTAAYLDEARGLFERHPELLDDDINRRAALRTIAKSIDNRYGEMHYNNLFWNKTLKDIGIGSFLSLGWNLGFLREFGGGALEPFLKNAIEQTPTRTAINLAKNKTAFAMIYMAQAMALNALVTKFIGGSNFGDETMMDYFLPRIGGTNPDGSPRRISNMFYTRELPMLEKHIEEKQSIVRGVASMLWNKMMFEPITELWNNRNYYGFNIYDETAPEWKQLYQMGQYIFGDQFNPIGFSSAKRALQNAGKWNDDDSIGEKIRKIATEPESLGAIAGFAPAPSYASKTATLNRLYSLFGRYVSPTERPQAEQDVVAERTQARNAYNLARQRGDQQAIQDAAKRLSDLGITTKQMKQAQPGTQDLYMFSRLPYTIQKQFLMELGPADFRRYFQRAQKQRVQRDPEVLQKWRQYNQ